MKRIPEETEEKRTVVPPLLADAPDTADEPAEDEKDSTGEKDIVPEEQEDDTGAGDSDTGVGDEDDGTAGEDSDPEDDKGSEQDGEENLNKKESLFDRLKSLRDRKKAEKERRRKEKDSKDGDDSKDTDATDDAGDKDDSDDSAKDGAEDGKSEKDKKGQKGKKSFGDLFRKKKEIADEDEKTNPKIRLYNEIVRHALKYDKGPIDRSAVPDNQEMHRIFIYVQGDYPELFWLNTYAYTPTQIFLTFRCTREDGSVDVKQVERKRKELAKAAKVFTRGITRKTKPYTALLTIYRRLILTLDYDSIGLKNGAGTDVHADDSLRSLYSALVEHKVVCAGYAVAMQYLLHSVGISCAYVISESGADGGCHAFNALRIGRECYYLDATWGDTSNTAKRSSENSENISYDYCCVPLREFQMTSAAELPMHTPRAELYPKLEKFTATRFEYFRHRKAYLVRYDENELVRIFMDAAIAYDRKEMGTFQISFRCPDVATRNYVVGNLVDRARIYDIFRKAKEKLPPKYKKKQYLLDVNGYSYVKGEGKTTFYCFPSLKSKGKGK